VCGSTSTVLVVCRSVWECMEVYGSIWNYWYCTSIMFVGVCRSTSSVWEY